MFDGKIGGMRVPVLLAVAALVAATSCAHPADDGSQPRTGQTAATSAPPSAQPVAPDPAVGAVFLGAGTLHTCSAAVLNSLTVNLILTAAHCLASGVDATFVAGFHDDAPSDEIWHVDAIYLDRRWVSDLDPHADFAIARVSRAAGDVLQTHTGGGLALGAAPKPGAVVTVTGYGLGVGGGPVSCTGTTGADTDGFPSLACGGVVAGLSGAPWIDGTTVTGIVGGLHGGGCDESVSYSPPFDDAVTALLTRAQAGGPADVAPTDFEDDC